MQHPLQYILRKGAGQQSQFILLHVTKINPLNKVKEVCDRNEARLVRSFYRAFISTFLLLYEEHLCSYYGSDASAEGRCNSTVTNTESRGLQFLSARITCQVEIFLKS